MWRTSRKTADSNTTTLLKGSIIYFQKSQSLRFYRHAHLSVLCDFLWLSFGKSYIIMGKSKKLKVHRARLPGRLLCSIRSNRKWCKRRGSSLQCQNCFFVYPIIDCNLKNFPIYFVSSQNQDSSIH